MKRAEFYEKCLELLIDPGIALENENVIKALKTGDDKELDRILRTEF